MSACCACSVQAVAMAASLRAWSCSSVGASFWVSVALAAPVLFLAMADMVPGQPVQRLLTGRLITWVELVLATPVVLWGGWPFFERGWRSIDNKSPTKRCRTT